MQVDADIAAEARSLIPAAMRLEDKQQSNQEAKSAYYIMAVFVYGFLLVIALVAFINILNMVNAGVSNRMRNYGIMRAVGMSSKQLKKIISAEAAVYAVMGCIVGGTLGLLLHRLFFELMVSNTWGDPWQPPFIILLIVVLAALLTMCIAVIAPAKRIENMSIVNAVNAD
jgi:putative ABC transport system permease protein